MPTARERVAAQIKADNPRMLIVAYPYVPTNVAKGRHSVAVWRSDVNPTENGLLAHEVTVNLYGAKTAGEQAEEDLEAAFDQIMLSFQRMPEVIFKSATRQTFDDVLAGWQFTVTAKSTNPYKAQLLKG